MVEEGSGRPRWGRSEHRRCHSLAAGGPLVPADAAESVVVSERVVPVGLRLPARRFLVRKLDAWGWGAGERLAGLEEEVEIRLAELEFWEQPDGGGRSARSCEVAWA